MPVDLLQKPEKPNGVTLARELMHYRYICADTTLLYWIAEVGIGPAPGDSMAKSAGIG